MVHKPKHKVHSFRGLLGVEGQDEIYLERQNVNLAYRIVKFEVMNYDVGVVDAEHVVKIYREKQTTVDNIVDFTVPDLLAAAIYQDSKESANPSSTTIIFDNTLFSRNIWVSQDTTMSGGTEKMNYYIELEEVPVGAATLMQLKLGMARKLSLSESPSV